MTTGTATSIRTDNEDIEIEDRFSLLGSVINNKRTNSQETCHRLNPNICDTKNSNHCKREHVNNTIK